MCTIHGTHLVCIQVTQALLGQCRKRTLGYKAVAIATTGEVVDTLGVDIFAEFSDILFPLLTTVSEQPGPVWTPLYVEAVLSHL